MFLIAAETADTYSPTGVYVFLILLGVAGVGCGMALWLNLRNYRDRIITNSKRGAERRMLGSGNLAIGGQSAPSHLKIKLFGASIVIASGIVILISIVSLAKHD
ncbi:hypothetical protein [Streptacidiphilus sp. PAMC 29251]